MNLSKLKIKKSFEAAAHSYNEAAFIQSQAGEKLICLLSNLKLNNAPEKIADIGSGTGYLAKQLAIKYPQANISCIDFANKMLKEAKYYADYTNINYINADFDNLPMGQNNMDMVCSNFALQWSLNLSQSFKECIRVLKPRGYFLFSTLGPETLKELNASWKKVDDDLHVNHYENLDQIKKYLLAHNMKIIHEHSQVTAVYFRTVLEIMKNLKAVGANYVVHKKSKNLMSRKSFNLLNKYYEDYRNHINLLPVSYEIIYMIAQKSEE